MHTAISSDLFDRPVRHFARRRGLLIGTVVALGLVAVPAVAQASSRTEQASSFCSKVSAASVSAIVGHFVPAGSPYTYKVKATKQDHEIAGTVWSCTYGAATSVAALTKDAILSLEVTSKPLTGAELEYALAQAEKLKMKFTPYPSLGANAFYYTYSESGIAVQGMVAIAGTSNYSAGLYIKTPAMSKLAALVKLAEKL